MSSEFGPNSTPSDWEDDEYYDDDDDDDSDDGSSFGSSGKSSSPAGGGLGGFNRFEKSDSSKSRFGDSSSSSPRFGGGSGSSTSGSRFGDGESTPINRFGGSAQSENSNPFRNRFENDLNPTRTYEKYADRLDKITIPELQYQLPSWENLATDQDFITVLVEAHLVTTQDSWPARPQPRSKESGVGTARFGRFGGGSVTKFDNSELKFNLAQVQEILTETKTWLEAAVAEPGNLEPMLLTELQTKLDTKLATTIAYVDRLNQLRREIRTSWLQPFLEIWAHSQAKEKVEPVFYQVLKEKLPNFKSGLRSDRFTNRFNDQQPEAVVSAIAQVQLPHLPLLPLETFEWPSNATPESILAAWQGFLHLEMYFQLISRELETLDKYIEQLLPGLWQSSLDADQLSQQIKTLRTTHETWRTSKTQAATLTELLKPSWMFQLTNHLTQRSYPSSDEHKSQSTSGLTQILSEKLRSLWRDHEDMSMSRTASAELSKAKTAEALVAGIKVWLNHHQLPELPDLVPQELANLNHSELEDALSSAREWKALLPWYNETFPETLEFISRVTNYTEAAQQVGLLAPTEAEQLLAKLSEFKTQLLAHAEVIDKNTDQVLTHPLLPWLLQETSSRYADDNINQIQLLIQSHRQTQLLQQLVTQSTPPNQPPQS
jgi:hypothetical protein